MGITPGLMETFGRGRLSVIKAFSGSSQTHGLSVVREELYPLLIIILVSTDLSANKRQI